ncbi:hypothetical protein ABH15_02980 [Methanoculleus taiwanensis]|uniref:DUF2225 domain-containing protein n=2 Tax=Methanoculleus taiwanensis TaxID=1550565 RepID=A0A498H6P6_9EURY|nr:hypothetical protein ABH15_02980 [Methanoculleus taiwanensis]
MPPRRYFNTFCAVCGEPYRSSSPDEAGAVGSRDLDTRPAEPLRSTIYAWVQRCPSCGYAAPDIGRQVPGAKESVKLPRYREQLDDRTYPKLANTFLCWSLIEEDTGLPAKAAWACIHAAWVCDDQGNDVAARLCRKRAATLMKRARDAGGRLAAQEGGDDAILVDILRRAGRFREARTVLEGALKNGCEPLITDVLQYQKRLIQRSDRTRHTIDEVRRLRGLAPR